MRILYIDIDSLRPDHLGCYGYRRSTSPAIDRVAAEGVRFDHCYASDMPCMPSRTSLFSGRFGIHHGCVAHAGTRAEPFLEGASRPFRPAWGRTGWMRQLRDAGYRTVTFSGFGERHGAWHWYAGFQEIHDTGHFGHEIADHVVPDALAWLQAHGTTDNWFLHVNLWDVHVPYRAPEHVGNRFADEPLPDAWLTRETIDRHRTLPGMRSAQDALFLPYAEKRPDLNPVSMKNIDDVKVMVDGYDTAIHYADQHVGALLSRLDEIGVLAETAVIISADHGECLGELNAYSGHCFADACTARVPMIIRWPGVTGSVAERSAPGFHYNIDLAATVCELLNVTTPDTWDAQSMVSSLSGSDDGREYLCLSQLAQACQRSVVLKDGGHDFLYLRTYRSGYHPMPAELLYDLADDPHETNDLAARRPELLKRASDTLAAWVDRMLEGHREADPLRTVLSERPELTPETYIERLEATGREAWIPHLPKETLYPDV